MLAPDISSSTTASRRGRPPGTRAQHKAERRLTRELAGRQAQLELLGTFKSIITELVRTANSNPVVGIAVSISAIDVLFRARVLSAGATSIFYGFLGAKIAGDVASSIASAIPFSGSTEERDSTQPTNVSTYYGAEKPQGPAPVSTSKNITGPQLKVALQ